ncbi:MAG: 50S ribosomal protein L19 [Candidatus Microsyncoccus archaeolyticus]|nr:MAG: 50S ribosomal protein L19 [Candidatus Parcubacteria bacterium]
MEEEAKTETVESTVSKEEAKGIVESFLKQGIPELKQGDTVKVYQKIKEKNKERVQVFEGQVLAVKHGKGLNATITVRKVIQGIGVEKIIPIHAPSIDKIEIVKRSKTRRSKLYYLRKAKGRKARLKIEEETHAEKGE